MKTLGFILLVSIGALAHYSGPCNYACDGCWGPSSSACIQCTWNAHWDNEARCLCDDEWSGPACNLYKGTCNDICNGCTGATEYDCKHCIANASKDAAGKCECDYFWSGPRCMDYIGSGAQTGDYGCDERCNGCTGTGANNCIECVNHAHLNEKGYCVCDEYWRGESCQNYDYSDLYANSNQNNSDYGYPDEGNNWTQHYDGFKYDNDYNEEYFPVSQGGPVYTDDYNHGHFDNAHTHYGLHGHFYDGYMGHGYYYGGYMGKCHPACNGDCNGPWSTDCGACGHHAHWYDDQSRHCGCDDGYYGYDCTHSYATVNYYYQGHCHDSCNGYCYGPESCDCEACGEHTHLDHWGYCVCDDHYVGHGCSHYHDYAHDHVDDHDHGYHGHCHNHCNGSCYGPEEYDCDTCIDNAYMDAWGYCGCNHGFYGDHCDLTYDGYYGHGHTHECGVHQHYDEFGHCCCDQYWEGDDCDIYVYYSYDKYSGPCDPICTGCTGSDPTECEACNHNAHWNAAGRCVCNEYWTGDDCMTWNYTGSCPCNCDSCTGPDDADCTKCNSHSVWTDRNTCDCLPYWTGDCCDVQAYRGSCDPKCVGCTGQSPNECIECVANASRNAYGYCICNSFWDGDDCSVWTRECDPICRTCNGPLNSDCDICVPNAEWGPLNQCECRENWSGDDCSTWGGSCYHTCDTCNGDEACDCVECVENAHHDPFNHGTCICNDYWINEGCVDYMGPCDPICNGCTGPNSCDCEYCVHHAHVVVDAHTGEDYCECDDWWTGDDCSVYKGWCDDKCDGCWGPRACDCDACVDNASFDNHGYCVCDEDWEGERCRIYIGPCDCHCQQELGCHGPGEEFCTECTMNSHRDYDGHCACDNDWAGDCCDEYTGECEHRCDGCHGPDNTDCEVCVENASLINGACVCDPYWTGEHCAFWRGLCDPVCNGCVGPNQSDCWDCTDNAERDGKKGDYDGLIGEEDGSCRCKPDWSHVADCSVYNGACDTHCLVTDTGNGFGPVDCSAPDAVACTECTANAHRDLYNGACVCNDFWSGALCLQWGGVCDPTCASGCTGPFASDCDECTVNAQLVDGSCVCNAGWNHIEDCSEFHATCDPACHLCNGPEPDECVQCKEHAFRNADGLCECEDRWDEAADCSLFDQDYCYVTCTACNGPGIYDCLDCVDNADRNYRGECVCDPDWGSADCSAYTGPCNHRCADGCFGPTAFDCNGCSGNFAEVYGECVCGDGWTGEDCTVWYGVCAPTCMECTGPTAHDCVRCVEHAWRVDGDCVCMPGWQELADCSVETIVCHVSCAACSGTMQNECTACYDGFVLSGGFCLPCDETCKTCSAGPGADQCDTCFEGKFASAPGACECCHLSCRECSGAGQGQCSACYDDSTLVDGYCQCNNGARGPFQFACVANCPFGYESSAAGCVANAAIYDSIVATTGFANQSSYGGSLDFDSSCHPPEVFQNTFVFNDDSNSLDIQNFRNGDGFNMRSWFVPHCAGLEQPGVIFSLEAELWDSVHAWANYEETCHLDNTIPRTRVRVAFGVDACHRGMLSVTEGHEVMQVHDTDTDFGSFGSWANIAMSTYNSGADAFITIHFLNAAGGPREAMTISYPNMNFTFDNASSLHVGSFLGTTKYMEGRMYDLSIGTGALSMGANLSIDAVNCTWNHFMNTNGSCQECDWSCTRGCGASGACNECSPTCKTCADTRGPGRSDECTSCYCGAEPDTNGYCACNDHHEGPANECELKCHEGCKNCTGTGEHECVYCEDNYEMTPGCWGTCRWCDENEADEDGYPSCGTRGIFKDSECDCTSGQWYDGEFCRYCTAGCATCDVDGNCTTCEAGLFRWANYDGCWDFCPFGYNLDGDLCTPVAADYNVYEFTFLPPEDGMQIWESDGRANGYLVRVYGGKEEAGDGRTKGAVEEPFIFADRGAWFDGKYDMMTFELLKLPEIVIHGFWTKVHSQGVLFSANRIHGDFNTDRNDTGDFWNQRDDNGYYLGVNDSALEYVSRESANYERSELGAIDYFSWSYVSFKIERRDSLQASHLEFKVNGDVVYSHDARRVYDFPEPKMRHHFGVADVAKAYTKHYRGFIYSAKAHRGLNDDETFGSNCAGCDVCHSNNECLGTCNWNHYFNERDNKCQRCPLWCKSGCDSQGQCC